MRLRYNRRGWFKVIRFLTGTKDIRTGIVRPDRYGCYERQLIVGPYETAEAAIRAM